MTTVGEASVKTVGELREPETDGVEALASPLGSVPGLVLSGRSRDTASDYHRSTCGSDSYRLGSTSDKSTATPRPLRFNVEIQTDPVEEEEEKVLEKYYQEFLEKLKQKEEERPKQPQPQPQQQQSMPQRPNEKQQKHAQQQEKAPTPKSGAKPEDKPEGKPEGKPDGKPEAKADSKPEAKPAEAKPEAAKPSNLRDVRRPTDSKETFASARDQSSPIISRGPTNDKRDGDQSSSTNSYDSVWDIPAGAEAAWKPALNSTELVRTTSHTPASEDISEEEEAVMRRLELTIEEIWWMMEDSGNTHRGSDDGPQNDP